MNLTPEQMDAAVEAVADVLRESFTRLGQWLTIEQRSPYHGDDSERPVAHDAKPAAPEVIMDANGNYWRRYEDGTLSMCPVSTDNLPLAEPVVVYSKEGDPR